MANRGSECTEANRESSVVAVRIGGLEDEDEGGRLVTGALSPLTRVKGFFCSGLFAMAGRGLAGGIECVQWGCGGEICILGGGC